MKEYSVVGKRLPRVDGMVKVTGDAKYTVDMVLPGMLYGKILRSPYPHAKILNIDTRKAEKLRGIKAVITGKDSSGAKYGIFPEILMFGDEDPLAIDKVRYIGDEVAAVAAIDEDIAEEALDLIEVEYEILPAVFCPEEAMRPGAPKIHDYAEYNINITYPLEFGNVEKGFKESDYIREDRFMTQMVQHCTMEPHATLASFDPTGKLTIWASTQDLNLIQDGLAISLNMPKNNIRVIKPYMGGGFGSKIEMFSLYFCAALLSKRTQRPVKITYTREEVLTTTRTRHPMIIDLKTGVKKDGTLLAKKCRIIADTGAYASTGGVAIELGSNMLTTIYNIPNIKIESYAVYTNKVICGAMRGHGAPQPFFANECQMDMIAKDLGIDPVDLRLKNAHQTGDITHLGSTLRSCGLKECIQKASESLGWKERRGRLPRNVGIGIGCSTFISGACLNPHLGYNPMVKIHHDGTITLLTGSSDIGQGSSTVLSQIAAEELGVALEDVRIISADTGITSLEQGSWGSQVTFMSGNAVKAAAADAKRQLFAIAAERLEANVEDLEAKDQRIYVKGSPEKGMSYSEVIQAGYLEDKMPITGRGRFTYKDVNVGRPWLPGEKGDHTPAYSFGASAAEVEVDIETGKVKVLKMSHAHDCGFAINPMAVEGQQEGSIAGGSGYGLFEDLLQENGLILNPSLLDYKILTALDIPEVKTIIVETIDPRGPFGAKEAGEGIMISPTPAIANAIYNAIGVNIKDLPITPEKILKQLIELKAKG